MLSICLSLIITSLRPFTRKPFNYEGGSSHKPCSCIFSAKLPKMVYQAFLHPAIEHFGAGFRSGTGVGWGQGSRSVCFRPLPEGSPVMGRGGKLCILRTMEALRMKVGRRQGSSCREVQGSPEFFQHTWAGPSLWSWDRAMAGLPYIPDVSLRGLGRSPR